MSDKQTSQASQRKPSTNKNIKKLRTVSMVCSLTSSWQQWAADNERKQASEPSGWSPSSLGGPTEEPKRTWVPKKRPPTQSQLTEVSQNNATSPEESKKTVTPHKETQEASKTEEVKSSAEPPVASRIKTKQVVKTVTSGVQEKSAGISLLTEKIKKETMPSAEEIDRLLKKKSSPTRRRKCSNMVSSLTKSWKRVENEQKLGKDGGGPGKGGTCVVHKDNSGHSETEKERQDIEDPQTNRTSFLKDAEEKDSEGDFELGVRIKRPSVSSWVSVCFSL